MKSAILHTKPSARPGTAKPSATRPGTASGTGRVRRAWLRFWLRFWLRLWLRYRLDAYTRSLHSIAAQRENDFHAERLLHRAISATRSRLQSL